MISGRDVPSQASLSADLLHGVFETSPVSLVVTDRTGTITHVNNQVGQQLDISPTLILGCNAFDKSWQPRDANGYPLSIEDNPFARALNGLPTSGQKLSIRLPDGQQVSFRVNCAPVYNENDQVIASVAALEDQTASTLREQELRAKNQQLESLASVLSHDLRNPLAIARGYLDLARETGDGYHLERVMEAHQRMEELIDSLLLLARRGEAIGKREPVSLAAAVRTAWATVETGEATLTVDADLGTVQADRVRLQQLLENLFRNSVEHGGDGVHITVEPLDNRSGFVVGDNGSGLPGVVGRMALDSYLEETEEVKGLGLKIIQAVSDGHGWQTFVTPCLRGGAQFEIVVDDSTNR